MVSGRSKFTRGQRADARQAVRECVLSRFSRAETLSYVRNKLKRPDVELYDIDRIKSWMRDDTSKWMRSMMADRWAYAEQYKERIDEQYRYEKEYWRLFYANPDNAYLQKSCLDSLQNVSAAITQLYDVLPEVAAGAIPTVGKDIIPEPAEAEAAPQEYVEPRVE